MDLGWIASLLAPYDMGPHPNFPGARTKYTELAGLLLPSRAVDRDDALSIPLDDAEAELVSAFKHSVTLGTVKRGVARLRQLSLNLTDVDLGKAAAAALASCVGGSDLDDFDRSIQTVSRVIELLESLAQDSDADVTLLQAVLLQQRAYLRFLSIHEGLDDCGASIELLKRLEPAMASTFAVSTATLRSSAEIIQEIVRSLSHAARSLQAILQFPDDHDSADLIREAYPSGLARLDNAVGHATNKYADRVFRQMAEDSAVHYGESSIDMHQWEQLVCLQLLGHPRSRLASSNLGVLRILDSRGEESNPLAAQDVLRYFRLGRDHKRTQLVTRWFVRAGSLPALKLEAEHVLRYVKHLSRTDIALIDAGGDVLNDTDVSETMTKLYALLDYQVLVPDGRWASGIAWKSGVWQTIFKLARSSEDWKNSTRWLLEWIERSVKPDADVIDRELSHVILRYQEDFARFADWNSWQSWINRSAYVEWPLLAESVTNALAVGADKQFIQDEVALNLDSVIDCINRVLRGEAEPLILSSESVRAVIDRSLRALEAGRDDGGFPKPKTLDAAIAFEEITDDRHFWGSIWRILLDENFPRSATSTAFDRLAKMANLDLSPQVAASFKGASARLLYGSGPFNPFEQENGIIPSPSVLRFLAGSRLLDESDLYEALFALSSGSGSKSRSQAAATIAFLASRGLHAPWMTPISLTLSNDEHASVIGNAVFALALIDQFEKVPALSLVRGRILAALEAPGTEVPMAALSGLQQAGRTPGDVVLNRIDSISINHLSHKVRVQAKKCGNALLPQT